MIKIFALFLISIGVVCAAPKTITLEQAWAEIPRTVNNSQCLYLSNVMKFSCRGEKETIDCDAFKHLNDVLFPIFGIGRRPTIEGESVKFWLYPKVFNTTTYLNHTVLLNETDKEPVSFSLYQSDKFIESGIRITDMKCYQRLVQFFDAISSEHVAELESDLEVKPKVSLLSEVLIIENTNEKRGFGRGFGGFGRGFGRGFGFGGFGLGGLGALALLSGGFGFGFPGFGFGFGFPFFG